MCVTGWKETKGSYVLCIGKSIVLNIAYWNANGLNNKKGLLINFLLVNKIDILIISETKFNENHKLKITGFTVVRKDNIGRGDGLAVIIKNSINFTNNIISQQKTSIENIHIVLDNLSIVGVYNTPQNRFTENCLNSLLKVGNRVVVIGDLTLECTSHKLEQ